MSVIITGFLTAELSAQASSVKDSTGLPGDNFSLQGALEMFKQSGSPEEFEKLLNTRDNHVNNLDLNGDGDVDYVRVVGKKDNDVHVFVLQVPVSGDESQDIAAIELEKSGEAHAVLQIVGDEDIYGEQTIVEPDGGEDEEEDTGAPMEGKGPLCPGTGLRTNVCGQNCGECVALAYRPVCVRTRLHGVGLPVAVARVSDLVAPLASAGLACLPSLQGSPPCRFCGRPYPPGSPRTPGVRTGTRHISNRTNPEPQCGESIPGDKDHDRKNENRGDQGEDHANAYECWEKKAVASATFPVLPVQGLRITDCAGPFAFSTRIPLWCRSPDSRPQKSMLDLS